MLLGRNLPVAMVFVLLLALGLRCGGGGGGTSGGEPGPSPLAQPLNLQATPGDASVTLSWSPVAGASTYSVYMATQGGVTKANYGSLPGGARLAGRTSPATVAPLLNGTAYYFVVTAVNASSESAESTEVQATPRSPGFTAPQTGPAYDVSASGGSLAGGFTNPSGYTTSAWFEYGTTLGYGSATPVEAFLVPGPVAVSATLAGLPGSTAFHFRLVTENSSGRFAGDDRTFTTLATPEVLVTGLDAPVGLSSDGTYVYWFEIYGGRLRRLHTGTSAVTLLDTIATFGNTGAIAIDAAHVYYTGGGVLRRADLGGSNASDFASLADVNLIVPHATGIYARVDNRIVRISLDGTLLTDVYTRIPLDTEGFGGGMVADETYLYWSDYFKGTIQRWPLSGGTPVTLAMGLSHPWSLLLDGATLYVSVDGEIRKLPAAGGPVVGVAPVAGTLAKDGPFLYVATQTGLARVDPAAGTAATLANGVNPVGTPAVTSSRILWLNRGDRYYPPYGSLAAIAKP